MKLIGKHNVGLRCVADNQTGMTRMEGVVCSLAACANLVHLPCPPHLVGWNKHLPFRFSFHSSGACFQTWEAGSVGCPEVLCGLRALFKRKSCQCCGHYPTVYEA
ncbi:uncharacterized protein LOC144172636 [Haemaphysalis longicornis]